MGVDDEFERIVAGLGADLPSDLPADATAVEGVRPGGEPDLAVVITPVASAAALAGLCAMSGLSCKVLPTDTGAVAAIAIAPSDDPFAELATAAPAQADEFAAELSRITHAEVVLVVTRLSLEEEGPTGRLTAHRYSAGTPSGTVSPGLVLATLDPLVEDLVLGVVRLEDVRGVEDTATIPRWKAARMFTRGLRKRRQ